MVKKHADLKGVLGLNATLNLLLCNVTLHSIVRALPPETTEKGTILRNKGLFLGNYAINRVETGPFREWGYTECVIYGAWPGYIDS